MRYTIFVVEDDVSIRELYEMAFDNSEFSCHSFVKAEDMFEALKTITPSLFILDLMLPGMNGLSALNIIKNDPKTKDIPVIIVSAKGDEESKVNGLDLGADDYIAKPFGMLELIARVKANLRKSSFGKEEDKIISAGEISINDAEHVVYVNEKPVVITLKEYNLLKLLIKNIDNVITREKILKDVWGYDFVGETRTLDMHVKSLRSKLSEQTDKSYIKTVRGVGYKFSLEQDEK
ncbi:MAG: response regulator transcription factor [Christensenella sp.]|nr:response regulator transcription factor [Christensenella sp.]